MKLSDPETYLRLKEVDKIQKRETHENVSNH